MVNLQISTLIAIPSIQNIAHLHFFIQPPENIHNHAIYIDTSTLETGSRATEGPN